MADPFDDLFDPDSDLIGGDFEEQCPGLKPVTLRQINVQDGSTTLTVEDVPALKRVRDDAVSVPGVGYSACRFLMRLSTVGFTPTHPDEVEDATGVTWIVGENPGDVRTIAFGQILVLNVTRKRTDAQ